MRTLRTYENQQEALINVENLQEPFSAFKYFSVNKTFDVVLKWAISVSLFWVARHTRIMFRDTF